MKAALSMVCAASLVLASTAVPQFAAAQAYRDYGAGDVCASQRRAEANKGTVAGAVIGGLLGGTVAGHGAKTEGALLGAGVGAVAGHQIAKHNVKCTAYPRRVSARPDCHWVNETYNGRNHGFEVCRDPDGVWRPSGRA